MSGTRNQIVWTVKMNSTYPLLMCKFYGTQLEPLLKCCLSVIHGIYKVPKHNYNNREELIKTQSRQTKLTKGWLAI